MVATFCMMFRTRRMQTLDRNAIVFAHVGELANLVCEMRLSGTSLVLPCRQHLENEVRVAVGLSSFNNDDFVVHLGESIE